MKNNFRSPHFLALFACLGLAFAPAGCASDDTADTGDSTETSAGDGDGDMTGDGDGDMTGDGDGDGDPATGDGDGDMTGDGDGDETGDGDGDMMGDLPNGATCTNNGECMSGNCYLVPFLGGYCGECDEDVDCAEGGCTPPNPFDDAPVSTCNMGEAGGGCETDEVCQDGLSCGVVLDLLGLISVSTCGECASDAECMGGDICAPVVIVEQFSGENTCIEPGSLGQDEFCDLMGSGDMACENVCSAIDIEGLAELGACGECNTDDDCNGGTCVAGEFVLESGQLSGSVCM